MVSLLFCFLCFKSSVSSTGSLHPGCALQCDQGRACIDQLTGDIGCWKEELSMNEYLDEMRLVCPPMWPRRGIY